MARQAWEAFPSPGAPGGPAIGLGACRGPSGRAHWHARCLFPPSMAWLPRPGRGEPAAITEGTPMNSGRTMHVLVVDDDPVLGRMFLDVLRMAGHDGQVARSGVEALKLAAAGNFDVLISDLRMPNMGGLELWEQLKSQNSAL